MEHGQIQNLIKELIEKTNVKVENISIVSESPKNTWFKVEVAEPQYFTLREGEALQALSHLVRRIVENNIKEEVESPDFMIDINGFQQKKVDAVRAVAHMMAERARYFKSSVEVDPMSSFERRIVHEFLSNETDIKTESEGYGPTRRVVIKYIGPI